MNFIKKYLFALFLIITSTIAVAQELNARVSVVASQVSSSVDKKVFVTLQTALNNFLNKRKWTSEAYGIQEKINCNFLLNVQASPEANVYKASLTVQAARPIFNTTYQAALLNYQDNDIVFRYVEFQPIEFNENRMQGTEPLAANLSLVFAYYVQIILGIDNDSFSPRGGDANFQKANIIVNSAPDDRSISGWKAFDGQRNRYWLAENLQNSRYALAHDAIYSYYRLALDKFYEDEAGGRQGLLNTLNALYTLYTDNQNIMFFPFFFQGKSTEIIKMLKKADFGDRSRAVEILQRIDITNASKYIQELK
jgi:hypothetical protein